MSILIKGMEMPDSCFHCKLAEVCQHYKAEHYANKRHEDCPLEEVPSAQPEKVDIPTVDTPTCDDAVSRQAVKEWLAKWEGYIDADIIARMQYRIIDIPSAQPETHEERTETHACDCISRQAAIDALNKLKIYRPLDSDRYVISDCLNKIVNLPSAQLVDKDMDVPCTDTQPDLSEYSDKLWKRAYERGRAEAQPDLDEVYAHAETEAEARFHAQQRWISCSERLPEEGQEILATTTDNAWGDVVIIRTYYKEMHKSVIAWMPLPEPYAERRTDGSNVQDK